MAISKYQIIAEGVTETTQKVEKLTKTIGEYNKSSDVTKEVTNKVEKAYKDLERTTNELKDAEQKLTSENISSGKAWNTIQQQLKLVTEEQKKLDEAIKKTNNTILENIATQAKFERQQKASSEALKQMAEAQRQASIKAAQAQKEENDERERAIRDLNRYKLQAQAAIREIGNQENVYKKKSSTGMDLVYFETQIREAKEGIEAIQSEFGDELKSEINHAWNGIRWSELNNGFREARDEADDLSRKIIKAKENLAKLSADPIGNKEEIDVLNEKIENYRKTMNDLIDSQKKITEEKGKENNLTDEQIEKDKELLEKVRQRMEMLIQEKEQAVEFKQITDEKNDAERQLISLYKEQYQLENKITKLSTDEKGKISAISIKQHQNEIGALKQELNLTKSHIAEIKKEVDLKGQYKGKIKEVINELENERKITNAHNKDLQNQGDILSKTIKNFAKFTIYYQSLRLLRQGISQALETMRNLDKAMTNVRLVTEGSVEDTNRLAQEYNQLAKEMGATTTAVAEGAGEWFNESRDH